jgi:hypothetical protein
MKGLLFILLDTLTVTSPWALAKRTFPLAIWEKTKRGGSLKRRVAT